MTFILVVCSPVTPLRFVTLRLPLTRLHVVVVSFLMFFFLPQKRAKCISVSCSQSLYSQYWHNHFTKEKKTKQSSQLFLTVAQYRSVVYCSIITLYAAASHRTFLGEIKSEIVKTSMFYLWSKK